MKSKNTDIRYIEITEENIVLATQIQMEIFPGVCGYLSFEKAYKKEKPYFLVYFKSEPIGTTGIYEDKDLGEKNTAWLGWYGILEKFRKKGLGRQILIDTVTEAARRGYDTFRLYTSAVLCSAACVLYDKIMDVGEDYTLEEKDLSRRVYSKSLNGQKVTMWNNRNLYLMKNHYEEERAWDIFNGISTVDKK